MEQLLEYIKPELLILIPVLYFVGMGLKKSEIKDNYIPWILTTIGIFLSALWVLGTSGITAIAIFTAITQGILCAGASVYVNQLVKQSQKSE